MGIYGHTWNKIKFQLQSFEEHTVFTWIGVYIDGMIFPYV